MLKQGGSKGLTPLIDVKQKIEEHDDNWKLKFNLFESVILHNLLLSSWGNLK